MLAYHLSVDSKLTYLTPKIPECAIAMYEDVTTKRCCFSKTINGCLSALQEDGAYYVYMPKNPNVALYEITSAQVLDAEINEELWCYDSIEVVCIGVIEAIDTGYNIQYNSNKGEYYYRIYNWHWVEQFAIEYIIKELKNPFADKWSKPNCSKAWCDICDKCQYGRFWVCPEEDKEEYTKYIKFLEKHMIDLIGQEILDSD